MSGIGVVSARVSPRAVKPLRAVPLLLAFLLLGGLLCATAEAAALSVVRELPAERTATSRTFLLSDGSKRAELFELPVHYEDSSGLWREIDTRLVAGGTAGQYRAASTKVEVLIGDEGPGQLPVRLSYGGASLAFDLLEVREAAPLVLGEQALYPAAAPATSLTYTVLPSGVKETLTLASSAAPSRFTAYVAHEGLSLLKDETGQWGFYRNGEARPVFVLGDLVVYDSARSAAGEPAYCAAATMSVTPAPGGNYVTYELPRAWLADRARVWPVVVDPTITLGQSVCDDTFISSLYDTTAYGSDADLKVGYYDATTGWNRSLLKFDTGALAGTYVTDAHLKAYQWHQYYASTAAYAYDAESGLYYLSARHYDPATRQFISKDPAKADGEESAYQYCGGDPINRVDPSGQRWLWDAIRSWTRRSVHYVWRLHWQRYYQWVRQWRKGERVVQRAHRVTQAEEDAHIQAEWNRTPASQRRAGIATLRGHSYDDSIDLSKVTWQERVDWAYAYNKIGKYETGKWFKTSVRVAYYYLVWAPKMIWYSFWVLQPL